jgi:oligopeptidase B
MHHAALRGLLGLSSLWLGACATTPAPDSVKPDLVKEMPVSEVTAPLPPVAAIKPYTVASPHGDRVDNYYWLRDDSRSKPEVIDHLKAETAYADAVLAHTKPAQELLYNEIIGRIKQDDATVPYRKNGYWYYVRFEVGKEYPIHARKKGSLDAPEEILLDANQLAEGKAFYQASGLMVSDDGEQLVYAEDVTGRRQYVLRFKNLKTGEYWPESIANVDSEAVFAADNKTVLYIEKDPVTLLGNRVHRHTLGTDPKNDTLIYEEQDESFYMGLGKGRSDRFIYIGLSSTVSTEWRYADATDPKLQFKVVYPRERDHEYMVEDHDDEFLITSNWNAKNFRLLRTSIADSADRSKWREWLRHRDDALIESATVLKDFVAINERSGGLRKIRIKHWNDGVESLVSFDEPAYTAFVAATPEYDNDELRFVYTSMTTPPSTYDLNVKTGARKLLKRDPVEGDFDPARYRTEFVFAPARDGTKIPVSLVYRANIKRDGSAPLYQYGYGSYGSSMDPFFSATRLSLLDRGVVYALAHVRGGEEMGRAWYENGRQLKKINSFNDFIDVTDFLVHEGYAAKDKIVAQGGSAGGLLMGAVANMAPEKYRAILADVPFVDVVTTMLDESIPLTTNEFDEWGNPMQKAFYDYMLSYSPYDNVKAQAYPAMLVTTGLHDSQVQYFEPAKWVAKLRTLKTDRNPLLFHVNMEAGHGGKSGRFQRYREIAMQYGFIFDQLGIAVAPIEYTQSNGFEVSDAR